jgi:HK97 gp10 family phage protein
MGKEVIVIQGFESLARKLAAGMDIKKSRKALIPVLKNAARPTLMAAKRLAPVGTRIRSRKSGGKVVATYKPGNLSKSIGFLTVKDRVNASIIIAIRSGKNRKYDGYYGLMVEKGTVNTPAQPFMGPAFSMTKKQAAGKAEIGVLKVIQKQLNSLGK